MRYFSVDMEDVNSKLLKTVIIEAYDASTDRLKNEVLTPNFFLLHGRRIRRSDIDFSSQLTLLLTTECNAGCLYCFADPEGRGKKMSFETAKTAIDLAFKRIGSKTDKLSVFFFGGGEPTLALVVIKKVKEYLEKEYSGRYKTGISTNGVFSDETREWMTNNIDHISLSCDGPSDIQNSNRPLRGGFPSSQIIEENIKSLTSQKPISMKATITGISMMRQEEIVEYAYRMGIMSVGFSPLMVVERSSRNNLLPINYDKFIESLLKAVEFSYLLNMEFSSEYLPIETKYSFCGFDGPNFAVTPDGDLSGCWESCEVGKDLDEFIYGKLTNSSSELVINEEKFNKLKERSSQNIPDCQNCFLKWSCAGGCAAESQRRMFNIMMVDASQCGAKRLAVKQYFLYLARKSTRMVKPYIECRQGGNYFVMYFNEFKLGKLNELADNPLMEIDVTISNLKEIVGKIIEYRDNRGYVPTFFFLRIKSFDRLDLKNKNDFIAMLDDLKINKIHYIVVNNISSKLANSGDSQFWFEKYQIPRHIVETLDFFTVIDGKVYFGDRDSGLNINQTTKTDIINKAIELGIVS